MRISGKQWRSDTPPMPYPFQVGDKVMRSPADGGLPKDEKVGEVVDTDEGKDWRRWRARVVWPGPYATRSHERRWVRVWDLACVGHVMPAAERLAIRRFIIAVNREAERTIEHMATVEGAHYAAMLKVARAWDIPLRKHYVDETRRAIEIVQIGDFWPIDDNVS